MAQGQTKTRVWARRVESDSLRHPDHVMQAALKTWRSLKGDPRQFELVDEMAQDRGPQLTLGYRNVIMLAAGFRRRTGPTGRPSRTQEPCVVFVVKTKWPSEPGREDDPQKIPPFLLAHVTVEGRRVRCAVPTDVQAQESFRGTRTMGNAILQVGSAPIGGTGTAACAVQIGAGPSAMKLLLSAHHVFSPFPDVSAGTPQSGLPIRQLGAANNTTAPQAFATSSRWGGAMRADGQPSFDAQFAKVSDWDSARDTVSALMLSTDSPYAGSAAQVMALGKADAFEILVPPNNPEWHGPQRLPTRAALDAVLSDSYGFDCDVRENGAFVQRHLTFQRLIRMQLLASSGALLSGDSGAAVVARRTDGAHTLIGLFIASGDDFAYAIPAWQLFDKSYYARLPGDGPIVPVPV